jgi:hypothetical protein
VNWVVTSGVTAHYAPDLRSGDTARPSGDTARPSPASLPCGPMIPDLAPILVWIDCNDPECPHDPEPFWSLAEAEQFAADINDSGWGTAWVEVRQP